MKRSFVATTILATALFFGAAVMAPAVQPVNMSIEQLKLLIAKAKTPAEHAKVAAWYKAEADRFDAQARGHEDLAATYRLRPAVLGSKTTVPLPANAEHCAALAKSLQDAAKADRELPAEQEAMARDSGR